MQYEPLPQPQRYILITNTDNVRDTTTHHNT